MPAWLLVAHRLGRDVREAEADVDAGDEKSDEGDIERGANIDRITNHSAGCAHNLLAGWKSHQAQNEIHTQVSNALPKHDASLQFPKDNGTPRWLNQLAGDDVGDENVSRGPANDGEELSALDNQHAGAFAGDDSQDLRNDSNRRHKGLDHESGAGANLLDRPSCEE